MTEFLAWLHSPSAWSDIWTVAIMIIILGFALGMARMFFRG